MKMTSRISSRTAIPALVVIISVLSLSLTRNEWKEKDTLESIPLTIEGEHPPNAEEIVQALLSSEDLDISEADAPFLEEALSDLFQSPIRQAAFFNPDMPRNFLRSVLTDGDKELFAYLEKIPEAKSAIQWTLGNGERIRQYRKGIIYGSKWEMEAEKKLWDDIFSIALGLLMFFSMILAVRWMITGGRALEWLIVLFVIFVLLAIALPSFL